MALIKCPNCGRDISDKAKKCVHCKMILNYDQPQSNTVDNNGGEGLRVKSSGGKSSGSIIFIVVIILFLIFLLSTCSSAGSETSSSSTDVYYCGFCGKKMTGGYYDYFDNKYVCRSCSKKYRER